MLQSGDISNGFTDSLLPQKRIYFRRIRYSCGPTSTFISSSCSKAFFSDEWTALPSFSTFNSIIAPSINANWTLLFPEELKRAVTTTTTILYKERVILFEPDQYWCPSETNRTNLYRFWMYKYCLSRLLWTRPSA